MGVYLWQKALVSPTLTNGTISLSEICGAVPPASPGAYQDAKSGALSSTYESEPRRSLKLCSPKQCSSATKAKEKEMLSAVSSALWPHGLHSAQSKSYCFHPWRLMLQNPCLPGGPPSATLFIQHPVVHLQQGFLCCVNIVCLCVYLSIHELCEFWAPLLFVLVSTEPNVSPQHVSFQVNKIQQSYKWNSQRQDPPIAFFFCFNHRISCSPGWPWTSM